MVSKTYHYCEKDRWSVTIYCATLFAGYGGGKIIECGIKNIIKHSSSKNEIIEYVVHTEGKSNEGKVFHVGDKFKVLEKHGNVILIEILGDMNNPYFVDEKLLIEISNYK